MSSADSFVNIDLSDEESVEPEASEPEVEKKVNPELERLAKQLVLDYSRYFKVNINSEMDELNECIDNLLAHMEEFHSTIQTIREEGFACLDQLSITMESKMEDCRRVYSLIEKLKRIVAVVSGTVRSVEKQVARAEKMMGKKSAVSRLFSLLAPAAIQPDTSRHTFAPIEIFQTKDLLQL